jgi:hypothetical protein
VRALAAGALQAVRPGGLLALEVDGWQTGLLAEELRAMGFGQVVHDDVVVQARVSESRS